MFSSRRSRSSREREVALRSERSLDLGSEAGAGWSVGEEEEEEENLVVVMVVWVEREGLVVDRVESARKVGGATAALRCSKRGMLAMCEGRTRTSDRRGGDMMSALQLRGFQLSV